MHWGTSGPLLGHEWTMSASVHTARGNCPSVRSSTALLSWCHGEYLWPERGGGYPQCHIGFGFGLYRSF